MSDPDAGSPATPLAGGAGSVADAEAPEPLDVDGVAAVAIGTLAWAVALAACLVLRGPLEDAGRGWWIWVCVSGVALGLPGLWYVRRRREAYRAAR